VRHDAIGGFSRVSLAQLFRVTPSGVLIAERLVEGVGVSSPVRGVKHDRFAAAGTRFVLKSFHQQLADTPAAETLADDQAGHLAARLVPLDEVLDVQDSEAGDLFLKLGEDKPGRGICPDSREPRRRLLWARRVAQLAEKAGDRGSVAGFGLAKRYGGGGGCPPGGGGASFSTYVALRRPH
jgi:hypothetical protein